MTAGSEWVTLSLRWHHRKGKSKNRIPDILLSSFAIFYIVIKTSLLVLLWKSHLIFPLSLCWDIVSLFCGLYSFWMLAISRAIFTFGGKCGEQSILDLLSHFFKFWGQEIRLRPSRTLSLTLLIGVGYACFSQYRQRILILT